MYLSRNLKSIIETGKLHHHFAKLEKQSGPICQDKKGNNNNIGQLACFTKGSQAKKAGEINRGSSEDSEDEQEGMVCHMTGEQLEQFPFPIIVDSGACTSVMPTSWCPHVPIESTTESRAGEFFRAAIG